MSLSDPFKGRLSLPVIAAPMFLASGPDLVVECCKSGIVGSFPALNQRTSEGFEQWLIEIKARLHLFEQETGKKAAPFAVNLIVHKTNPRLGADLEICIKHQVPLIITSLGAQADLTDAVHSYGGLVFHDVVNVEHAKKAADAGVDGLIGVAAGAGGHAGSWSPFALINEIRKFFDKTVVLSGCQSTGGDIAAAQAMGADLGYLGTRFLATQESMVSPEYKQMLTRSSAQDVVYTPFISGLPASFLAPSIKAAGIDIGSLGDSRSSSLNAELADAHEQARKITGNAKAWKDIWSAGQGAGSIEDIPRVAELVTRMVGEYDRALHRMVDNQAELLR